MSTARIIAAVAALLASACVHRLPPPAQPERAIPDAVAARARTATPDEGRGVVVLDIVDGSGSVEDLGFEADGAHAEEVCAETPCVAQLAQGEHRLVFHRDGRDDEVTLSVGTSPRVHRRVMSYDSGEHREYVGMAMGGFVMGGMFLPLLGPLSTIDGDNVRSHDVGLIFASAIGGAALVTGLVGVVLALVDPQETREGLSLEWDLAP